LPDKGFSVSCKSTVCSFRSTWQALKLPLLGFGFLRRSTSRIHAVVLTPLTCGRSLTPCQRGTCASMHFVLQATWSDVFCAHIPALRIPCSTWAPAQGVLPWAFVASQLTPPPDDSRDGGGRATQEAKAELRL